MTNTPILPPVQGLCAAGDPHSPTNFRVSAVPIGRAKRPATAHDGAGQFHTIAYEVNTMSTRSRSSTATVHPRRATTTSAVPITTNAVLKGGHDKYDGAIAAAEAVTGARSFKPSIAAAAREFRTSSYLTKQAMFRIRIPTQEELAVDWWDSLSESARNAIFHARQNDVVSRLDAITAPDVNPAPQRLRVV